MYNDSYLLERISLIFSTFVAFNERHILDDFVPIFPTPYHPRHVLIGFTSFGGFLPYIITCYFLDF